VSPTGGNFVVATREPAPSLGAGTFRVRLVESTGRTVFNREYLYRPRRLNDETVAVAIQTIQTPPGWPPALKREVDPSEIREKLYRPAFLPPLEEALLASDGTIWLRRSLLAQDTEALYLVLNGSGDLMGELGLPRSARVLDANGDWLWASDYSFEDEPLLVRYKVKR